MTRTRPRFLWLVAVTVALATVVGVQATTQAHAQDGLEVSVRGSEFQPDGTTRVLINVTGPVAPDLLADDAVSVAENGNPVSGVSLTPLLETEGVSVTAAFLVDSSGSMAGEPIELLREAGVSLVEALTEDGIAVGLIEFDNTARVLATPTTDGQELAATVAALEAGGNTALFDAIVAGVDMLREVPGVRTLVLFADGEDNISEATQAEALSAASDAGIPITVIALDTDELDIDLLRPLAEQTDGQFIAASDVSQFQTIFTDIADDVASQYVVEYVGTEVETSELDLAITVDVDGSSATTSFTVVNSRDAGADAPPAANVFDAGVFGQPVALWSAIAVAFLGLLLFLLILLVPKGDRATSRTLATGLALTSRGGSADAPSTGLSASGLGRRVIDLVETVPKREGYEDELQTKLDRAGWQLRTSEFTAVRAGIGVATLLVAGALTGSLFFGILAGVAGFFAPLLVLVNAIERRQLRFMEQLPGTLQLLAGTLRAGYGTLQGIDTIVKETQAPMATEFQRVLTEARLGLPLEESLEAMAERVDDDDFRWVIVAMNIQRQVGGNLAALLETVSETLRSREAVRRQIKVLSAEGRLSAIVLVALPFLLGGYMVMVNPEYMAVLVTEFAGLVMLVGVAVLMFAGVLWIRKMIQIDV